MYPDKYLNDLESSERRSSYFQRFGYGFLTLLGLYLVGPIIHELGHLLWLEFQSCLYRFSPGINAFIGFYGRFQPLCYLPEKNLAVFYGSGYLTTLLSAFGLRETGVRTNLDRGALEYLAIGMLLSILVSITYKGDVRNMMEALNLPSLEIPFLILVVLGVLGTSFMFLEEAQKGRNES